MTTRTDDTTGSDRGVGRPAVAGTGGSRGVKPAGYLVDRGIAQERTNRKGSRALSMNPAIFVRRNTAVTAPPLLPEIRLHLATEVTPIWQASEESLARGAVPPPFWAFAWVGGQALGRYLLDHPETVAGRTVLDFGSGSGLVAIAAAIAGARRVLAAEIDHFAAAAIAANAMLNDVAVGVTTADIIGAAEANWEVVTAGDVCYERGMAERAVPWLRALAGKGRLVLLGDPGRAYLPAAGLVERARYPVPTSREIEDRDIRETVVWQVLPR
jgi:predicted nicotinamide N-methyase